MVLVDYIEAFLGNLYDYLDYDATDIAFIEDETLEALEISSESDASSAKALHAVARVKALEKCLNDLSVDYKFSADGSSYDQQQVFDMVSKRLELAVVDAIPYLPENTILVGELSWAENPYDVNNFIDWVS